MTDDRRKYLREAGHNGRVEFLNKHFEVGLDENIVIQPLDQIREGTSYFWSDIWVTGKEGEKGRYLVKEVLNPTMNAHPDSFAAKTELLRYLQNEGVPVILPINTGEGGAFSWVRDQTEGGEPDHLVELYEFYPTAAKYEDRQDQLTELGDVVGRITSALNNAPEEVVKRILARPSIWQKYQRENGMNFLDELDEYERIQSSDKRIGGELGDRIDRTIPCARREYQKIKENPKELPIPRGFVHGDIQRYNVLFDKNTKRLIAVIDWDSGSEQPRTHDLAYTVDRVAMIEHGVEKPDRFKIYPERAQSFLNAFSKHYALSTAEEKYLFDGLVRYTLPNTCGILRDIFCNKFIHKDYALFLELLYTERMREVEQALFGRQE